MPKYKVLVTRTRLESAIAYVTADSPNDICIDENDVMYAQWVPDDYDTDDFTQRDIEEVK